MLLVYDLGIICYLVYFLLEDISECNLNVIVVLIIIIYLSRARISFFPRKRISLPTFMNSGELKFLKGIEKHFWYFTIFELIISTNTNIAKKVVKIFIYISNYPVFNSQREIYYFQYFCTNIEITEKRKKIVYCIFKVPTK